MVRVVVGPQRSIAMCFISANLSTASDERLSPICTKALTTDFSCCALWWKLKSRYLSVWATLRKTLLTLLYFTVFRHPFWQLLTFTSKTGRDLSLSFSKVNNIFRNRLYRCRCYIWTCSFFSTTNVSSTYPFHTLTLCSKLWMDLCSSSPMNKFAIIMLTGRPIAAPCFWL